METTTSKVYAIVFEDPNDYIMEYDDIRRETYGVYETLAEAKTILEGILVDNPFGFLYSIREWEKDLPF
jgi:hypothetical protein